MKHVLVIGAGLSGLSCALELAERGISVTLASSQYSERSQSVLAAGGINAALAEDDSVSLHAEETWRAGGCIADRAAVEELCSAAADIVDRLCRLGVLFNRAADGSLLLRAFGGQSRKRTAFAGVSTGKQIMSALIRKARKYECSGALVRLTGRYFSSALIEDGVCYGAVLEGEGGREQIFADAVVMATGGANRLFGKTTGSTLNDGHAVARLFEQGVRLRNPEFVQFHPTTVEAGQKHLLISEAARAEGGRLYYLDGDRRVYFMEERYGKEGNLQSRDVVARAIAAAPSQVYLDLTALDKQVLRTRLSEVVELCGTYLGLDVYRESIPVCPSAHYFMGGLSVDRNHQTSIGRLYAVGECCAMYHGANRLGGNSLLSAIYGARVAAASISALEPQTAPPHLVDKAIPEKEGKAKETKSSAPLFSELFEVMHTCFGVVRSGEGLLCGIERLDRLLCACDETEDESLRPLLLLARAALTAALERKESRGAHFRADFPEAREEYALATEVEYSQGAFCVRFEREGER